MRFRRRLGPAIGFIGCGQFAFSTIAHFLYDKSRFVGCYDSAENQSKSFADSYSCKAYSSPSDLLRQRPDVIYIASNHASHTAYALEAMRNGIAKIYIEKPISVTHQQLAELVLGQQCSKAQLYAGYNRPFSKALVQLRDQFRLNREPAGPFTISCFVSGHQLSPNHWYRNPNEGTRICGNLGHWIDLVLHIFSWRSMPEVMVVQISYADSAEPDDNLCVTITTNCHDLAVLTLTSRCEPFEGINETINFQHGEIIAKIDDFRVMTIWRDDNLIRHRYIPKDVGHESSVLQPFSETKRDWNEVLASTLLMLMITELVRSKRTFGEFILRQELAKLESMCESMDSECTVGLT